VAPSPGALSPDLATVAVHDPRDDREPNAGALELGRLVQALEG